MEQLLQTGTVEHTNFTR